MQKINSTTILIFGLFILIFLNACSGSEPRPVGFANTSKYDLSAIDQILQDSLANFQGGVVVIIMENDQRIYEKFFGNVSLDVPIRVASASKWVTTAVLLSLVD